jgi:phage-related protein
VASSKKELISMPQEVQDTVGFALHLAQHGGKHPDAKPLRGFGGSAVLEVVENFDGNTFRAVYTVRFNTAIYVLHCFQKKSVKGIQTSQPEVAMIKARFVAAEHHSKGLPHD